jgi:ribonuclease BN (tRNA processing enzyme)
LSEVIFVGTSDAFGAGGRRQAAIAVRAPGGTVLLDCGTTTATGLNALGIPRQELDAVLVSHFHADHFGGIPSLLLGALYEDRRRRPLRIAGPPGIEERVRAASAALGHPLDVTWPFALTFQELPAGSSHEVGPIRVRSFETHHQVDSCPHGLILDTGADRIVYSGDTGWFDGLPGHVRGADLFICECTFVRNEYQYHLSYDDLITRKGEFDCHRMVLTHLGEAMSARRGSWAIETADDGMVLRI